jgi:hypothetical protein
MRIVIFFLIIFMTTPAFSQGIRPIFDYSIKVELRTEDYSFAIPAPVALPLPAYPPNQLRARISGEVVMRLLVAEDGKVLKIARFSASQDEFAIPTEKVAPQWKFAPLTGVKVPTSGVWIRCRLIFKMEEE